MIGREKNDVTYLTVEQVAERLQVSTWTVKRWLREGELVGIALGDRAGWRVAEDDLARFMDQRKNVVRLDDQHKVERKKAAA